MSTEIPYQPIPEARKHVTQKRMKEILAKHSQDPTLAGFSSELWLVSKIRQAGGEWRHIDVGVTTRDQRRERVRAEIRRSGLAEVKCGKKDGRAMTFGEVFERVYGETFV